MAKSFVFDRFDMRIETNWEFSCVEKLPASDGDYVLAHDAVDRDEVLKAQIRVLEIQLKESREEATVYRIRYNNTLPTLRPCD